MSGNRLKLHLYVRLCLYTIPRIGRDLRAGLRTESGGSGPAQRRASHFHTPRPIGPKFLPRCLSRQ